MNSTEKAKYLWIIGLQVGALGGKGEADKRPTRLKAKNARKWLARGDSRLATGISERFQPARPLPGKPPDRSWFAAVFASHFSEKRVSLESAS